MFLNLGSDLRFFKKGSALYSLWICLNIHLNSKNKSTPITFFLLMCHFSIISLNEFIWSYFLYLHSNSYPCLHLYRRVYTPGGLKERQPIRDALYGCFYSLSHYLFNGTFCLKLYCGRLY